ncbi:MAG: FCD domain-containing protein, partial [Planctomycetota bacterium]
MHFGRRDALAWYDHGVESTAWALRALLAVTPDDPRIPGVVRWLLENRAGAHYDSTRSTAAVALALSEHLRRTGELACEKITDDEIAAVRGLHKEMLGHYRAHRLPEYFKTNEAIHTAILNA